jgi:hypothetical protein
MQQLLAEVEGWAMAFEQLLERISPRFVRPEVRHRVAGFLRGLLGDVARKNGWQLAEHAGETTPDGMQRLLTSARWDPDGLRDDVLKGRPRFGSDRRGQLVERDRYPLFHWRVHSQLVVSASNVLDERVPHDDDPGATVLLEPSHRSQACLQPSVIRLDRLLA